jgi:metal-responsive CopG/Arc/MetJ family transcriptional regulator
MKKKKTKHQDKRFELWIAGLLLEQIDKIIVKLNISRAEFIRQAIKEKLKNYDLSR